MRGVVFQASGHPNIRAKHRTTLEITKESHVTPRGDCIVGVNSEIAARDLPEWFKEEAKKGSYILLVLCSNSICDSVIGTGTPSLSFSDDTKMVFRRSTYSGPETVMVKASKAAGDLRRDLVDSLVKGGTLEAYLILIPRI